MGEPGLDDHLHAFEQFVVGGVEQCAVEGEVGLDGVAGVAVVLVHRPQRLVEGDEVALGAALRGEADGGGFDDGAHLGEVAQQRAVGVGGAAALELPAQYVGVEQVPVAARADEGAAFLPGVDHALGGEDLQGLAQGGEAHVEFALQGHQVEGRALGDVPTQDAAGQGFHGLAVHTASGVARHVGEPFC
ncbi:hypothetical protein SHKM778_52130 [Streptomyces sp. KM77-8]|uniref:Uncharacterized protein n=1 Tax=Streptomyces haneummycinicus TaxID=3074435 RepID=A0AAT9HMS2_9ACTN